MDIEHTKNIYQVLLRKQQINEREKHETPLRGKQRGNVGIYQESGRKRLNKG